MNLKRSSRLAVRCILSLVLCLTLLVESSPLALGPQAAEAWSSRRSSPPVVRRPAPGVRAAVQPTLAPEAIPIPSPQPEAGREGMTPVPATPAPDLGGQPVSGRSSAEPGRLHLPLILRPGRWSGWPEGGPPAPPGVVISPLHVPPVVPAGPFGPLDVPLALGWNLISVPEVPSDTSPAVVLASIAGKYNLVYAYDGCDAADPWKLYDPTAPPPASDLTAIDHRIGFWIEMTAAGTLTVDGTVPTSTNIQLCRGWNLIGYPLERAHPVPDALASIAGKYTLVFAYDPTDPTDPWQVYDVSVPAWANDLQVMEPGRGYWVKATEDVTLVIAEPTPTPTLTPTSTPTSTPTITPTPTATRVPVGRPPTADITSPAEGTEVTDFVDIIGTADDPDGDLAEYRLQYRQLGSTGTVLTRRVTVAGNTELRELVATQDAEWTTFATGNAPVVNGVLGRLDPTLMLNGMFEIRVLAIDSEGQQRSDTVTLIVKGEKKIGHFTLSFVDLTVPVGGLDIEVIRTYDSRTKRLGDFGYGWTLDVTDVSLAENSTPGRGWEMTVEPGFFPTYCLQETTPHIVTVTFPDGTVHAFRMTVSPECQSLIPPQYVTASFAPLPGTHAQLTPLGETDLVVYGAPGGPVTLRTLDFNIFDPRGYRLTLRERTRFVIDQAAGLRSITDPSGNSLTFSGGGITHSAGKSVTFTRDGQGRIARISDPLGNTLQYAYDAAGDLASFTDRGGNVTTFTYATNHYLQDIRDPLGRQPSRTEYDADGRIVRQTDADGKTIQYAHDLTGRKETLTDRLGNVSTVEYDANGYTSRITGPDGQNSSFTNDSRGNRTSKTNPLGDTTRYAYNAYDQLTSETDPLGNTSTYSYDSAGLPLSATDPLGNTANFSYNSQGSPTLVTDALGNQTTLTYDSAGNVTSTSDPLGCTMRYEYDAFGNLTRQVDPLGNATTFTYDANGNQLTRSFSRTMPTGVETLVFTNAYDSMDRRVRTILPDGSSRQVVYDAIGKRVAEIDQLGRRIDFEYDDAGRPVKITYPDGTFEAFTYDAKGRLLTSRDPAGRVVAIEYDALDRPFKTTLPDGSFSTLTHDAAGRLVARTDARGNTTRLGHDAAGRTTSITDTLGGVTRFTYDAAGRLTSTLDARGNPILYTYNANGQRTRITYTDGTSKTLAYDARGAQTAETDPAGNTVRFEYDCLNRLTKVVNPLGGATTYTYDEVGQLIRQTDARGNTTRFDYDRLGRLIRSTLPLGQFETATYDATGNLISRTDFNGNTITYEYDASNRLVKKTYPDHSTVAYTYTPTGQRASVTDSRGTTRYEYDTRDRLVKVTHPDGRVLSYTYDPIGNRTSVTTPAGTTTYAYDALNRLVTVTAPDSGVTRYTYDAVGNRTSVTYPNGTVAEYTYDNLNQLTRLTNKKADGTVISSYTYTLGPAGNRLGVIEHTGRTVDYTYDALYRLIEEKITDPGGNATTAYTYDAVGNRLTRTADGAATNYAYDADDRLLSENDITYTYDANGNVLSKTSATERVTYQYDFENRLIQATTTRGAQTTVVRYVYDADGLRVQKIVDGANTTNYLFDTGQPLAQVLLETDGAGATLASYVYGDDLVSMARGGHTVYYHYDGQMSTRQLTDAAGNITDQYVYDAFGNLLNRTGATANDYLYTGQQHDPAVGLYYLRARYYNPAIGRFMTQDTFPGSLADPLTLHKYLYANADPVNNWDPTGRFGLASMAVSTSMAGSLASMYNGMVVEVGFTMIHVIEGVSQGYSADQIFKSWLVGQAIGIGIMAGAVGLAAIAKYGLEELVPSIRQALRGKASAAEQEGLAMMLRHMGSEMNRSVGAATKAGSVPWSKIDNQTLVAALRLGDHTTAEARDVARMIEAGEIHVHFMPQVAGGKQLGQRLGNTILVGTEGRSLMEIAATTVHEGTHVRDLTARSNILQREMNAFVAEFQFLKAKSLTHLDELAQVWEKSGMRKLMMEIMKMYQVVA